MNTLTKILLALLLLACSKDPVRSTEPKLLVGLSLQQHKNSSAGLDGYREGLDYAVERGINIFGMSPEWNVLEPTANTYSLQDNLTNPLTLLDADETKLASYILVLKMIDTNVKLVLVDLENTDFDDGTMINRFSSLLEKIFSDVPHINRVSHILIGNEIDGYLSSHPDQVEPFKTFFTAAIQKIHTLSSTVKVGTIITFNAVKNNPDVFKPIISSGDFICYTYYPIDEHSSIPWQMRPVNQVEDDFAWMIDNANGKSIAFTEIGYTSSPDHASSETQQSEFVDVMFRSLAPHIRNKKVEFLYYHGMYDYPENFCVQYAQQQGVESTHLCGFMNNLGLHNWQTAQPKEAWSTFISELKKINE